MKRKVFLYMFSTLFTELEKQLQFAESRCRSLKQQLDYIKLLYGCNRFPQAEIRPAEGHGDGDSIDYLNFEDSFSWNNCHAINKSTISRRNIIKVDKFLK